MLTNNSKLHCWCREAGKCECAPECSPTLGECTCIEDFIEVASLALDCGCIMFPATQGATGYLTNTHDVLRRGAH